MIVGCLHAVVRPRSTTPSYPKNASHAYMSCILMGGYGQNPAENRPSRGSAAVNKSTAVAVASSAALSVVPSNPFPQPNPCPACLPACLLACLPACPACDGVLRTVNLLLTSPQPPLCSSPSRTVRLSSHARIVHAIVPRIRSDLIASFFRAPSLADPIRFERRQSIARIPRRPNSPAVGGFRSDLFLFGFAYSTRSH